MAVSVPVMCMGMSMAMAMAVIVVVMLVVMIIVMMVTERVSTGMQKRSPTLVEQQSADENNRDPGEYPQYWNDLLRNDVARKQQRTQSQQEDADGMREGDGGAQQRGMLHVAPGPDQISSDDGLA